MIAPGAAAEALLAEATRYQALITPRPGAAEPVGLELTHDWPSYLATGAIGDGPSARATVVTFTPPTYAAIEDPFTFTTTHLAVVRTRLAVGEVTAQPARGGATRARALMVLPAGG